MTRQHYVKALHYFMTYLHIPLDAYDKLLDKDTKTIQMKCLLTYQRHYASVCFSQSFHIQLCDKEGLAD